MICPTTCGCHNSLRGIEEKTHILSQILRSTRLIRKNELIAVFGLTAAITNKPEILALKQAQEERNSDLYRTSIQYTILGNIHGKEVYLVPPQDAALLLQDRISPGLRKQLKQQNTTDGLGQFANHTCCDSHWNANLENAAVDHHEETTSEPMGILRAKKDIEPDTEIPDALLAHHKGCLAQHFCVPMLRLHKSHRTGPRSLDHSSNNGPRGYAAYCRPST